MTIFSGQLIEFLNGKKSLLYQNFTFFEHYPARGMIRWSCSNHPKCKAFLYADKNLIIQYFQHEHNHPPRSLVKTADGFYSRI